MAMDRVPTQSRGWPACPAGGIAASIAACLMLSLVIAAYPSTRPGPALSKSQLAFAGIGPLDL